MKTNGRICEKVGRCDGCGFKLHLSLHRKLWLCRGCLVGVEVPLRLEDFVVGTCPLGNLEMMEGEVPDQVGQGSQFSKDLDAALKREGLMKTRQEVKELMAVPWFAGRR